MPHYYFDTRDNGGVVRDSEGVTLRDDADAHLQAAITLAEMARGILTGVERRHLSIDARDGDKRAMFTATLVFEVTSTR